MVTGDIRIPEQELFLWFAIRAEEEFRARHGHYASQWYLLDMKFALPYHHPNDPDVLPTQAMGSRWKPRGCLSTYVIKEATASTVLIQAVSDQGIVEYDIIQGMTDPRKL